jgi:hypothetical protein
MNSALGSFEEVKHLYFTIKSEGAKYNDAQVEVIDIPSPHDEKEESEMPRIPVSVLSAAFYAAREKKTANGRKLQFEQFDDWYRYYEDSQLPSMPSKHDN